MNTGNKWFVVWLGGRWESGRLGLRSYPAGVRPDQEIDVLQVAGVDDSFKSYLREVMENMQCDIDNWGHVSSGDSIADLHLEFAYRHGDREVLSYAK